MWSSSTTNLSWTVGAGSWPARHASCTAWPPRRHTIQVRATAWRAQCAKHIHLPCNASLFAGTQERQAHMVDMDLGIEPSCQQPTFVTRTCCQISLSTWPGHSHKAACHHHAQFWLCCLGPGPPASDSTTWWVPCMCSPQHISPWAVATALCPWWTRTLQPGARCGRLLHCMPM